MVHRYVNDHGYMMIRKPEHRFHHHNNYILEHRIIYEESRNCCLLPRAAIHHIDGNRLNNVWYNLMLMSMSKHNKLKKIDKSSRVCKICKKTKTIIDKARVVGNRSPCESWYKINDEFICKRCYSRNHERMKNAMKNLF